MCRLVRSWAAAALCSSTIGAGVATITVDRSASTHNGQEGILADGAGACVLLANSTVISNGIGLQAINGGRILSYQNNQLNGNVSEGTPPATLSMR